MFLISNKTQQKDIQKEKQAMLLMNINVTI